MFRKKIAEENAWQIASQTDRENKKNAIFS